MRATDCLRRAVGLYRGDVLDGVDGIDLIDSERDRLRSRFAGAAVRAGELALISGDPQQACGLAQRSLAVESTSEVAYRLSASAHLALGDHAAARVVISQCRVMLAELSATPDRWTLALERRLNAGVEHP